MIHRKRTEPNTSGFRPRPKIWVLHPGVRYILYGDPSARVVYVIEGLLKADISHCLTNRTFAAIAGANNTSQLDTLFALLAQNGTEEIIEAHDMDKYSNQRPLMGHLRSI